jgi:hypothetical protein
VLDLESCLPDDIRARLRAPVDLGAAARARVMQRVRAAAAVSRVQSGPRGMARPSVIGALLAASFVAVMLSAGSGGATNGDGRMTLADTIALHFASAADSSLRPPVIDRDRLVAVADETRNPAPSRLAAPAIRRD